MYLDVLRPEDTDLPTTTRLAAAPTTSRPVADDLATTDHHHALYGGGARWGRPATDGPSAVGFWGPGSTLETAGPSRPPPGAAAGWVRVRGRVRNVARGVVWGRGPVPGGEGVGGGSVGVDEGLVGGDGGEYGVGVLVGDGDVAVSPCSGVYVSAAEVLEDMRPRLGQPGLPVVEQRVGSETGGVCSGGERHRRGGDPGLVGLVGDFLLGRLGRGRRRRTRRSGGGRRRLRCAAGGFG